MKKIIAAVLMVCAMLIAPAAGYGYTFGQVIVEDWTGTGPNEAMCVVDFGGGDSYAFGYRWDGVATGENMLVALDSDTALTVDYSYHPTFGFAVDGISYDGHQIEVSAGWDPYYPAYWWSGNTEYDEDIYDENWQYVETITHPAVPGDGKNWLYAPLGASSRELADGLWDGWTQGFNWVADAPVTPVAPATSGDLNGDDLLNAQDVNPFVLAMTYPADWEAQYPALDLLKAGDIDGDGLVNAQDINPFVVLLTGGGPVPEPASATLLLLGFSGLLWRRMKSPTSLNRHYEDPY